MNILETLQQDYSRFPQDQTYSLYTQDVYFSDPLNKFRGVERYKKMITFLSSVFQDIQMDLHKIDRFGDTIKTEWTLHLTSPLPWKPRLSIPGKSELQLNSQDKIIAHIDYWHCSPWNVLRQNFFPSSSQKR